MNMIVSCSEYDKQLKTLLIELENLRLKLQIAEARANKAEDDLWRFQERAHWGQDW